MLRESDLLLFIEYLENTPSYFKFNLKLIEKLTFYIKNITIKQINT